MTDESNNPLPTRSQPVLVSVKGTVGRLEVVDNRAPGYVALENLGHIESGLVARNDLSDPPKESEASERLRRIGELAQLLPEKDRAQWMMAMDTVRYKGSPVQSTAAQHLREIATRVGISAVSEFVKAEIRRWIGHSG